MRFSVLLPTRNRLDLLKYAVATVLGQDYADWEVVISDNASSEDIRGYAEGLADARVRYVRSDEFLPVTDNWNRALAHSSGDYVVMLGDDDCLLPGYFTRMVALLQQHRDPELVYTEALQYAYPDVIPWHPEPFTQIGYCQFMRPGASAYRLDRKSALDAVRMSFRFKIAFSYNMQHSLISRRLIDRLSRGGPFFRSPYPDYYASNALFMLAETIIVEPRPSVVIGMSPKSFGFYYFNSNESQGVQFLNNAEPDEVYRQVEKRILPGSDMNTSWLLSLEAVRTLGLSETPPISYWRYRFMQYGELFRRRSSSKEFLQTVARTGNAAEFVGWLAVVALSLIWPRAAVSLLYRIHRSHPVFDAHRSTVPFRSVLELFAAYRDSPEARP